MEKTWALERTWTTAEITERLAGRYRAEYDSYRITAELAKKMLHDGADPLAQKAMQEEAEKQSRFLNGLREAAVELGVSADVFMMAIWMEEE